MTKGEKLKEHYDKIREIKIKVELVQQEWIAYNKLFNEWLQDSLGMKEQKGEVHLTELLTKWDQIDNSPTT